MVPSNDAPIAMDQAGMSLEDAEYHEINEAFLVVVLVNMMLFNLDPFKVNMFGGAIGLGHPNGISGAWIVGSL
jgi:acetyl-CoA C-acetyltransferase